MKQEINIRQTRIVTINKRRLCVRVSNVLLSSGMLNWAYCICANFQKIGFFFICANSKFSFARIRSFHLREKINISFALFLKLSDYFDPARRNVINLLSSSSCVPYVASFSGLSIFDCPFDIL